MIRKLLAILLLLPTFAFASGGNEKPGELPTHEIHPKKMKWEFDGFFGRFDKASIQRGFKVYKEVCSNCHSLKRAAYRNLGDVGFSEEEIKVIASEYLVVDGPDDEGEMFERPGLPSDRFVSPFANENAARSANGGAFPPDLSLIVKARHDGANYVYSLLMGYKEAPHGYEIANGKYYNPYFPGRQISMPPPISDDEQVEYSDGTYPTKEQMAIDIVNFLQFVAEPETEKRKRMGVRTISFLAILFLILLAAKKAVWKRVE